VLDGLPLAELQAARPPATTTSDIPAVIVRDRTVTNMNPPRDVAPV
jgi:hypothetical protein